MMRKPYKMVAPGNMAGVYRATRVGSSTCSKPSVSQDGAVLGLGDVEIDPSLHSRSLSGEEQFVIQHALEHGITDGDGCSYY
jgi:hypothetical protein